MEFYFYCLEYALKHGALAEQTIEIRYIKLIPCMRQEKTVPSWSSITMTHKKPKSALYSLIWPFLSPPAQFLWLSVTIKPKTNILNIRFSIHHQTTSHFPISCSPTPTLTLRVGLTFSASSSYLLHIKQATKSPHSGRYFSPLCQSIWLHKHLWSTYLC